LNKNNKSSAGSIDTSTSLALSFAGEKCIFSDDFSLPYLDAMKWKIEKTYYGGGSNEFEMYHNDLSNVFVDNGVLYLKPTPVTNSLWLDSTADYPDATSIWGTFPGDSCTGNQYHLGMPGCGPLGASARETIRFASGRIRTHETFSFLYGRVEVEAKLPVGKWIWPAIWLTSADNSYGAWPLSPEIDIMESRGNEGANQTVQSTLHWGSDYKQDKWALTHAEYTQTDLTESFHVYGLYWSKTEMYTYIRKSGSSSITKILDMSKLYGHNSTLWDLTNNTATNPWKGKGANAPFNVPMSLIMNVAVGGFQWSGTTMVPGYWDGFAEYLPYLKSGNPASNMYNDYANWIMSWGASSSNLSDPLAANTNAMQIKSVKVYANADSSWQNKFPTAGSV